ncbi:MAG: hypothetical protein WA956_05770 [Stenotrophomonas sp.]
MAITDNGTAQDINTLLMWLLPTLRRQYRWSYEDVPRAAAMAAAERLATKAHKQLTAGVHGSAVHDAIQTDDWRFEAIDNGGLG